VNTVPADVNQFDVAIALSDHGDGRACLRQRKSQFWRTPVTNALQSSIATRLDRAARADRFEPERVWVLDPAVAATVRFDARELAIEHYVVVGAGAVRHFLA
jgi:hypothetical protein